MSAETPPVDDPRKDSLIEYPCLFPIKVMATRTEDLVHSLCQLALSHDPRFDASQVELRPSKSGRYLGVTLPIWATSRTQLDALYQALTKHSLVKVVL